jgi:hypothetical protein
MSIALVFLLASLQGLVVRAGTANGVSKAIVELRLVDDTTAAPYLTTTLIDGGFSFHNLKPGRYRLSASRNGYVSNGAGSTITLTENDALTNFRIAMTLAGAVYGHVYDQKQHLLAGADVQAMKLSYEGGRSVLKFIQSATTNDLGEYRLFGLAPGRYYISALHPDGGRYRPPSGLVPGPFTGFFAFGRRPITSRRLEPRPAGTYVPIFFSDTPDEQDARPIDLAAGSEFGGADITVFPVPRRVVRGVIMDGTTGQAARNARLFVSRSPARVNDNPYIGVDSTGGSFEVSSLLPGSYTFVATAGALTGRNSIEIGDDDVNDITIRLAPGFNVAGRVTMDGGGSPPEGFRVSLRPDPDIRDLKLPGPPENGLVSSDGSFSLLAVPPGDYQLNVTLPPGLQGTYVKSVRLGAVDVLSDGLRITSQPDEPLQVIVGTNPGALVGRIVNAEHEPVPGVIAVLVPDLNERTRVDLYHSGSSDASGRFRFDGLAPGDYKLFAWEEVESEAWTDTEFLRSQEDQGTPVRIIEGTLVGAEAILILSRP